MPTLIELREKVYTFRKYTNFLINIFLQDYSFKLDTLDGATTITGHALKGGRPYSVMMLTRADSIQETKLKIVEYMLNNNVDGAQFKKPNYELIKERCEALKKVNSIYNKIKDYFKNPTEEAKLKALTEELERSI